VGAVVLSFLVWTQDTGGATIPGVPRPFLEVVLALLITVALELAVVVLGARLLYGIANVAFRRLAALGLASESNPTLRTAIRNGLMVCSLLLGLGIIVYNGRLAWLGENALSHTRSLAGSIGASVWIALGVAVAKLVTAAAGFFIATRLVRRMLGALEQAINRWDRLQDNDRSLDHLFAGLDRGSIIAAWLLLAAVACWLFGVPDQVSQFVFLAFRLYLVVLVGMTVIRGSVVIVDTLDGLGRRYAENRGLLKYHDHLRPLLPTFRVCVEYALWIVLGSLVIAQLGPISRFAYWGPLIIQALGIFFLGRVVVQLGQLEIGHRMLPPAGLDETTRRRRETMAPLVKTAFGSAAYFGVAVLILGSLGFNPMPFLAGAGILGLVIGFGAQSLINDVVSGFFVLFEDTYIIGDTIETGNAKGVVEGIEFRTTRIRDADGRLHILRNGDIKEVINYSKDYAVAVVLVDVPYDADLRRVFATLRAAGEHVRAENADVLQPTQIDGITTFGVATMTVRTSTRVMPGRHEAVAAALRLAIKEGFDVQVLRAPRKGLVA
jgi:moderate conductance mechanosensitive channel